MLHDIRINVLVLDKKQIIAAYRLYNYISTVATCFSGRDFASNIVSVHSDIIIILNFYILYNSSLRMQYRNIVIYELFTICFQDLRCMQPVIDIRLYKIIVNCVV